MKPKTVAFLYNESVEVKKIRIEGQVIEKIKTFIYHGWKISYKYFQSNRGGVLSVKRDNSNVQTPAVQTVANYCKYRIYIRSRGNEVPRGGKRAYKPNKELSHNIRVSYCEINSNSTGERENSWRVWTKTDSQILHLLLLVCKLLTYHTLSVYTFYSLPSYEKISYQVFFLSHLYVFFLLKSLNLFVSERFIWQRNKNGIFVWKKSTNVKKHTFIKSSIQKYKIAEYLYVKNTKIKTKNHYLLRIQAENNKSHTHIHTRARSST